MKPMMAQTPFWSRLIGTLADVLLKKNKMELLALNMENILSSFFLENYLLFIPKDIRQGTFVITANSICVSVI